MYTVQQGLEISGLKCPFNLHPIFSFEKMGAFATLEKYGRIQPDFFESGNLIKAGFHMLNRKNVCLPKK